MLSGKYPCEMIREKRTDPGHFREYTINELISIGKESGFVPSDYSISNYFNYHNNLKQGLYNTLTSVLPEALRDGIMISLQKV